MTFANTRQNQKRPRVPSKAEAQRVDAAIGGAK